MSNFQFSTIEVCSEKKIPVFQGTEFPVSRLVVELAAGKSYAQIVKQYNISKENARKFLQELAIFFSQQDNFAER